MPSNAALSARSNCQLLTHLVGSSHIELHQVLARPNLGFSKLGAYQQLQGGESSPQYLHGLVPDYEASRSELVWRKEDGRKVRRPISACAPRVFNPSFPLLWNAGGGLYSVEEILA